MITGKEDKSFSAEDVNESKDITVGRKRIIFAHKASAGEKGINLNALVVPPEMAGFGFQNPSSADIAASHLAFFKKNLTLKNSRGDTLTQYKHYLITDSGNLTFIGDLFTVGALEGEVFSGVIDVLDASGNIVADARTFDVTISCPADIPVGTTELNVGHEYEVNANALHQTGDIKPFKNGKRIYRNVGNATAQPSADGNYEEVDLSNTGFGTTVELNNPAQDGDIFGFDLGLKIASADLEIFGSLEQLHGAMLKLAQDSAPAFHDDNDYTRYLQATPSQLERRAFGDRVLALEKILDLEIPLFNVRQNYIISQSTSALTNRTAEFEFNLGTATIVDNGDAILVASDEPGATRTRFTATRKCKVRGTFDTPVIANVQSMVAKNGVLLHNGSGYGTGNGNYSTVGIAMDLEEGDYITVGCATTGRGIAGTPLSLAAPAVMVFTAEDRTLTKIKDLI